MRARLAVYLVVACLASTLQFAFFDCSGVRALSFVTGALTILLVLVVIDRVHGISVSMRSVQARIAWGAGTIIVGAGAVWGLAWFTIITHMCG